MVRYRSRRDVAEEFKKLRIELNRWFKKFRNTYNSMNIEDKLALSSIYYDVKEGYKELMEGLNELIKILE